MIPCYKNNSESSIMLRQQRIINFSFYHYKKSFKSSDVRSFHVTYSSFLRKVASSRKRYPEINSASEEPSVAGNFIAQPLNSTCNNFYGIESDEGVVHVSDMYNKPTTQKSSQNVFINTLISKKLPEKFKKTKFGQVRLDTENKVLLHGQFEESTSLSDMEETIRATRLRNFAIVDDSDANASPSLEETQVSTNESQNLGSGHFDNITYQSERDVKRSEIDVGETQNISLIDELYFPDKMFQNQESDSNVHANPSISATDASYIDECYFNNEPIEENVDKSINFTYEKSALSEEKLGYIDQSYFNTTQKSMNTKENVQFISECDLNSELKENNSETENVSSTNSEENSSFIDECFFNEDLESKIDGKNTNKHSIENLNKIYQLKNENKTVHKSNTEINLKNRECQDDKNPNYNRNTKIMKENFDYNSTELNQQSDTFTKVVSSIKKTHFTYKEIMKESLNSVMDHKKNLDKNLTKKYPNDEKLNQTTLKNNKISENIEDLNEKERQNVKEIQDDQPETAFDFVKKFRGDQKATYHESISGN